MKTTTDSITAAMEHATTIEHSANAAVIYLAVAQAYFKADCMMSTHCTLNHARRELSNLRRAQNAAIENIEAAIASAETKTEAQ